MSLCLGSQVWHGRAVLIPILEPEQPVLDTRGIQVYAHTARRFVAQRNSRA